MKTAAFLIMALSLVSALEWVDFTATDQAEAIELSYKLGAKAGGNGGGAKTLSCDAKDGIKSLCFQTGRTYLGKTKVTCGDGSSSECGIAKGNGAGGSMECWNRSGNERIRGLVCKVKSNYVRSCKALGTNGKVLKEWGAGRDGTEVSALPKGTDAKLIGTGVCGSPDHKRLSASSPKECAAKCKQQFPSVINVEVGPKNECDCDKSKKVCSASATNSADKMYKSGWRAQWKTYQVTSAPGVDNGKELRALALRCGWWMDAVQAGFGNAPPAPKNAAANAGAKNDFNSCGNGDAVRPWFNGPKMAGQGSKLTGSLYYRDQGWGNKKTAVFARCGSITKTICPVYTKRPASFVKCNVNLDLSFCKKNDQLKIMYRVGGGCGHRFYGKDAKLTVAYKKPMFAPVEFGLEELFVSPVFEDEIDTPAFAEAQEEETVSTGYTVVGAGALLSLVAVGSFYLGQRRNVGEYSALLDA